MRRRTLERAGDTRRSRATPKKSRFLTCIDDTKVPAPVRACDRFRSAALSISHCAAEQTKRLFLQVRTLFRALLAIFFRISAFLPRVFFISALVCTEDPERKRALELRQWRRGRLAWHVRKCGATAPSHCSLLTAPCATSTFSEAHGVHCNATPQVLLKHWVAPPGRLT